MPSEPQDAEAVPMVWYCGCAPDAGCGCGSGCGDGDRPTADDGSGPGAGAAVPAELSDEPDGWPHCRR